MQVKLMMSNVIKVLFLSLLTLTFVCADNSDEDLDDDAETEVLPTNINPTDDVRFKGRPVRFDWQYTDKKGEFEIRPFNLFEKMHIALKGQLNRFSKEKEMYLLFKKVFNFMIRENKMRTLAILLSEENENRKRLYDAATKRAEMAALVKLLNDSVSIDESTINDVKKLFEKQKRMGFAGLYVVCNKREQADDIVKGVKIGAGQKSTMDVFMDTASKVGKVKNLGNQGYPAGENYVVSLFGSEALEALTKTKDGTCSEPIKLTKDNRWVVIYLAEKNPIKMTNALLARYAKSKQINRLIEEYKNRMMEDKEIVFFVKPNELHKYLESSQTMSQEIAKVGSYKVTIGDVYRILEAIFPNQDLREMILSSSKNDQNQLHYFLMQTLEVVIMLHLKAFIAKDLGLDRAAPSAYAEYCEMYKSAESELLLVKMIKDDLKDQDIKNLFITKVKTMPKTKLKGLFAVLESKDIAEQIYAELNANLSSKRQNKQNIEKLFTDKIADYSIDSNSTFEERLFDLDQTFGELKYDFAGTVKVAEFKPNSIYVSINRDKYYIVYITEVSESQDITYEELQSRIVTEKSREVLDDMLGKVWCTKSVS